MSSLTRVLTCLLIALLGACQQEPTASTLAPADGEVVLRLPGDAIYALATSPDRAMFVSTFGGAIYRGESGARDHWSRVAQLESTDLGRAPLLRLHAFSRSSFFGIAGSRVYQWREDRPIYEHKTLISDSTVFCGDFRSHVELEDIWGRNERDVYVVGAHGNILHYDGVSWSLEPNPLHERAPSLCYQAFDTDLYSVGGDATTVYAAGYSFIGKPQSGAWRELPRPTGEETGGSIRAITALPSGLVFGGGEFQRFGAEPPYRFAQPARLFRLHTSRWEILTPRIRGVRSLDGGSTQSDDQALFWNYAGDVVIVRGHSIRVYRLSGYGQLRGAALNERDLYVATDSGDTAVVIRFRS